MATLPRRDWQDLASLVGEAADARPDAGRETAVTAALRTMPQPVRPGPRFTAVLRERLLRQARGEEAVPTSVVPE